VEARRRLVESPAVGTIRMFSRSRIEVAG
jgi:hypothetical protein